MSLADLSKALNPTLEGIYKSIQKVILLYMMIAMATATAKRYFLCLIRLKNLLVKGLAEKFLNHGTFMHIHQNLPDEADLSLICQQFVVVNDYRIFRTIGRTGL